MQYGVGLSGEKFMEFPSLNKGLYRTSLLDLSRRNVVIFSIAFFSFISTSILFGYARYTYKTYLGHLPDIELIPLADGTYQITGTYLGKPEWAFFIGNDYGLLFILLLLILGITALVQFGKLRTCLNTDLCLLRLLENIDARLGISISGEPKNPTRASGAKFKEGWYWDVATDGQVYTFSLQTD